MMNYSLFSSAFIMLLFFGLLFFFMSFIFFLYNYMILLDWEFLSLNSCMMSYSILLDWMSLMFLGSVMLISSMVFLYSYSYMTGDLNKDRFCFLVILFVISMMFLIMSPNLISILIGWDGLGLISYCLVIYFQNSMSYMSGFLTILMNRVGDVAILISIILTFNFGSWIFIFYLFSLNSWLNLLVFLIVLAGFTKSAQIPFSSWLPAAMAAPTPVSALVHSSTLVTAGVYLLIRYSDLLFQFNCSLFIVISLITMFMSGLGASFEFDLKKIIALSTLSQLGLMMSILFLGCPLFSFFHLLTHAFFKSLLFLCAGLIIHVMGDTQDIRYMGGISNLLYFTSICFCISSLSLCGFPFLSGFYSKDMIVEFYSYMGLSFFFYLLYYSSLGLTVAYSVRLIYYLFFMDMNMMSVNSYKEDFYMISSMMFLVFMCIVSGSLMFWLIFYIPYYFVMSFLMKMMGFIFIILGFLIGYYSSFFFYSFNKSKNLNLKVFFGSMWFMSINNYLFNNLISVSISNYYSLSELGWGEMFMSSSMYNMNIMYSKFIILMQLNSISIFMLINMFFMMFLFY
nr:NADH dehydrogenase subunit 5 [Ceratocombus japonicus]